MVGIIVQFPARRRHDRASAGSRAAKATIASAVNPAALATEVSKIDCQYSSGMLPRWRHLRAAATPAPMSDAMASGEGHNAMTSLNDAGGVGSIMDSPLGQFVLNGKAILSPDCGRELSQNCSVAKRDGKTDFRDIFAGRVKEARLARNISQKNMGALLNGTPQDTYKQWEKRSYMPHDLIPSFCMICGIDFDWLYTGKGIAPVKLPKSTKAAGTRLVAEPRTAKRRAASSG